jgi:hypothetical protein
MTIRERDRQPRAAMPAIPRHHRHPLTSQRMPRIGDFYFCWKPAGMILQSVTDFKDTLGWDQCQARAFDGICRHTALAALAQLRCLAIRGGLRGEIQLPAIAADGSRDRSAAMDDGTTSDTDLQIPLGDAPVPVRGGQPCPPGIAPIKLSVAETARLARLAVQYTAGLISRPRLAFALRWSARRRRHQAIARWHHYSVQLLAAATG